MKKDNEIKNKCDTRRINNRPTKALNGREGTILTILTQYVLDKDVENPNVTKLLKILKNEESLDSYRIANLILGLKIKSPTKKEIDCAADFHRIIKNWRDYDAIKCKNIKTKNKIK